MVARLSKIVQCTKCGNTKSLTEMVRSTTSRDGASRTCKPCAAKYSREYIRRDWFAYKTSAIRRESRKKRISFDLDTDFLRNLWTEQNGRCRLTGVAMTKTIGEDYKKASLDQILPGEGYTRDNVHFVTDWANRAKLQLSVQDFGDFVIQAASFVVANRQPK